MTYTGKISISLDRKHVLCFIYMYIRKILSTLVPEANGLVPSGNKPLPGLMLTKFYNAIYYMTPLYNNEKGLKALVQVTTWSWTGNN